MTFRTRLLLIFTAAIVASVAVVDLLVLGSTRRAFERSEMQRAEALVLQFHKEFDRRGARWCAPSTPSPPPKPCATSPSRPTTPNTTTTPLPRPPPTVSICSNWWPPMAPSSAALSGPRASATRRTGSPPATDWQLRGAFLRREELPEGVTLALVAVGTATEGDRKLYVVGGRQLDREFLSTLVLPAGMRVLLYRNLDAGFTPSELIDAAGPAPNPATLRPLIERVQSERRESSRIVGSGAAAESVPRRPASRARQQHAGRAADWQFAPRPGGARELPAAHRRDRRGGRHSARHSR